MGASAVCNRLPDMRQGAMLLPAPSPGGTDGIPLHDPDLRPSRLGYNPLRSLTLARVISLLEQGEQGYWADLQWLFRFVEKREATTGTVLERRQAALEALDWGIEHEKEVDRNPALAGPAKEQEEFLRRVFGRIDNLRDAWTWLGTATFRGFAHLEMHFDDRGRVKHLEPVPQWFFGMGYPEKQWMYNPDAQNSQSGEPINEAAWIIRECERPIDEIAALLFMAKSPSWKDWSLYCARHGLPNIFLEVTQEAAASGSDFATLQGVLERYVSGGRGVLPPGVKANLFGAGASSDQTPFPKFIEYIDTALVLRATGGKLTMLSDSTGIGQGATPAHVEAFRTLAIAEANKIATIMQRAIGEPLLNKAFPGQPHLARFVINEVADIELTPELIGALSAIGYRPTKENAEKFMKMPLEPMPLPAAPAAPPQDEFGLGLAANRSGPEPETPTPNAQEIAELLKGELQPAFEEAMAALDFEHPDDGALNALIERLPDLLAEVNESRDVEDAFEKVLADAFAEGLVEANDDRA